MNFGEIQRKVRRRLNESTTAFYSDDDIKKAINAGYLEMADATEFYERQAMIPMLKQRTYYDLSLILPDTFLSPRRAYNPETSRWLDPIDPRGLDYHTYVQWELTQGPPEKYLMRGNWWLGVFPKPTQDSAGIRFYYTSIPPEFTDDSDIPAFPREFHEGLTDYALCHLLAQERETQKAISYWTSFQNTQNALAAYVDGRQRIPQRNGL